MSISNHREGGVATLEMTLVLGLGMMILAAIVLFGRFTWHVIAMEKGVYNAARIVSTLPIEKISGSGAATSTIALGKALVRTAVFSSGSDIVPDADTIGVVCDGIPCNLAAINRVSIATSTTFTDTVFSDVYTAGLLPLEDGALRFGTDLTYGR